MILSYLLLLIENQCLLFIHLIEDVFKEIVHQQITYYQQQIAALQS